MSQLLDPFLRRLAEEAGVAPGARVLDIGCGQGETTRVLAALVGEAGDVVGVDRNPEAIALARGRDDLRSRANIRFIQADLLELPGEFTGFDAAIGRRVLMYVQDRRAALERIRQALRPGGVVAFQEHDPMVGPHLSDDLPLHRTIHQWMWRTVEREGADVAMGRKLQPALEQAGFVVEKALVEAAALAAGSEIAILRIVEAMIPRIVGRGVASAEEIGLETLARRLKAERDAAGATGLWDVAFGVVARRP